MTAWRQSLSSLGGDRHMVSYSSSEVSGFESCAGCCGVDIYHVVVPNWFIKVSVKMSMVAYT